MYYKSILYELRKEGLILKKVAIKIIWAIIATAILLPVILTVVINFPKFIKMMFN